MSYIIEQVKRRRQERNWSQKYIADCINVSQSFIYKAVIYIFTLINVGIFFLSIPIPGFILSDRVAWNGPVRLSFTDRRNSSLRSSDTTGRAFGNPNRTLVPAPMVFRHKTLHLTAELTGKEKQTEIYSNKKPDHPDYFQIECYFSNQDRVANSDHRRRISNEINLPINLLNRIIFLKVISDNCVLFPKNRKKYLLHSPFFTKNLFLL